MSYLVVGGGFGGLAAAHALVERHGVSAGDVRVLEASSRIGGALRPTSLAGQDVDAGPDALLTRRPEGLELLEALGLDAATVVPASGRAYLATSAGLEPYPAGLFLGIPLRPESLEDAVPLSEEGRRRALQGFELPAVSDTTDLSVSELVSRRWGPEVAERLAGPLLAAVHAGRADYLSAAACAPQLFPDARPGPPATAGGPEGGPPPFVSLKGGLWRLGETLRDCLTARGVEVVTGTPVLELARGPQRWRVTTRDGDLEADRVVLAVPADVAAGLMAPFAPDAAEALASVEMASVAIAVVLVRATAPFPEGSGFLVPPSPASPLLTACTWFDQKWPGTARPDGRILRLSTGRHGDRRFDALDDTDLAAWLVAEAAQSMDQALELVEATVTRFPRAFPQYAVGHLDLIRRVHKDVHRAGSGTLALCGNSYAGVGLPAVVASAQSAARALAAAA